MSVTYCCVVDNNPRFMLESIVWIHCLKPHLREEDRCVVGFVDCHPEDVIAYTENMGVEHFFCDTLFTASPHCNKMQPLLQGQHKHSDHIVITDSDVYIVDSLHGFLPHDRVRMPPNNHCNPPLRVFDRLFKEAGLPTPVREGVSLFPSEVDGLRDSYLNNVSGGVLICPRHLGDELAEHWQYWAAWLIENVELLGRWKIHVDQVSMAMAAEHMGRDIDFLPPQVNAVLGLLKCVTRVRSFHLTSGHVPAFARYFREDKTLDESIFQGEIRGAVQRLNHGIRQALQDAYELPSARDFIPKFHNPRWRRNSGKWK